jgi:hypothetical protein
MPERIQLRRTTGWRKPEGAIVVARPSKWGNPWPLDAVLFGAKGGWPLLMMTPQLAVELYRTALWQGSLAFEVDDVRAELRGNDLACWCPLDRACHADVLLELANR